MKNTRISEYLVLLAIVAVGLLVRLPYLHTLPGFGEANENTISLSIVTDDLFPLYNQNPHIGALSNYLVAFAFLVLGLHWWTPRMIPLALGIFTIVATYSLGRRWLDRNRAALGALLLATSFYHASVSSHFAWSNSLTPFFVITFFAMCSLIATGDKTLLPALAAGLALGFGAQTHPTGVIPAPMALVPLTLLFMRKRRARTIIGGTIVFVGLLAGIRLTFAAGLWATAGVIARRGELALRRAVGDELLRAVGAAGEADRDELLGLLDLDDAGLDRLLSFLQRRRQLPLRIVSEGERVRVQAGSW